MSEPSERCTHPWLRITCGVCGEAVDALGEPAPGPSGESEGPWRAATVTPVSGSDPHALFIVARGHPELLDQLRVAMGHQSGVHIIEDRRRNPRAEPSDETAREIRKRLREEGPADQG